MRARNLGPALLGLVAVVAVIVVVAGSGGDGYRVRLVMDNAAGLTDGSPVAVGGVDVGKVKLSFDAEDRVIAELRIDKDHAPISRDATAAISAVNLLGRKRVDLVTRLHPDDPAPSGFTIGPSRITESTDLDQVLNVLTPATRTRLAVLLNEAGNAFAGRKVDVNDLLHTTPPSLAAASTLLNEVIHDNTTLANVVERSDRFVNAVTARRGSLTKLIDTGGEAAATLASRRQALRGTLARAPGTLTTLNRFLGELQQTAAPLGAAARELTKSAPAVDQTLAAVEPFRKAADPTLEKATRVAPALTTLAAGATPVLRRAAPAAASLATFAKDLDPVSSILDKSSDNIIAILHNWSRAIQFRDGASHVFRGQPSVTAETVTSLIDRVIAAQEATKAKARQPAAKANPLKDLVKAPPSAKPAPVPDAPAKRTPPRLELPVIHLPGLAPIQVPGLTAPGKKADIGSLLDFLLKP
ncbi:MAG: Mammalian cell entry related protein [Solirubrobacterales bacterium]|nr:Mammalian cell entry related protein [Solirubrobacterales bacterium]